MRILSRKRSRFGAQTVYDSIDEAKQNGITSIKPYYDRDVKAGEWITYPDGVVAKVLHVAQPKTGDKNKHIFIKTILNVWRTNQTPNSDMHRAYHLGHSRTNFDEIDKQKTKFAEDWLINGKSISQSVKDNLKYQLSKYAKLGISESISDDTARAFAYDLISAPWFEKLLNRNRLIRDRYMSLVGAFREAGIDEDFLAKKVLEAFSSQSPQERINALNKSLEIVKSMKGPTGIVPAAFQDITEEEKQRKELTNGEQPKQLSEPNQNPLEQELAEILRTEHPSIEQRTVSEAAERLLQEYQA